MGKKSKYIIIIIFTARLSLQAQSQLDFSYVDSATYSYYLNGAWDKLINLGDTAIKQNIDFKYLRQRLGHAYYLNEDYVKAGKHFRKAYVFDSYDPFTLQYLYYSCLSMGQEDAAALVAGRMDKELRKSLSANLFKPVESVSAEYNFKYAGTSLRTNPQYVNFGISSRLGSRLALYQMISKYRQTITVRLPYRDSYINDEQSEYYALLKVSLARNLLFKSAYHYLYTTYSISTTTSHLGYAGLSTLSSNFLMGIDASVRYDAGEYIKQFGILTGINSMGSHKIYLTGYLSLLNENSTNRVIYTQKAGIKISKGFWLEGNAILGNLNNFNDFSAMYIYNSIDPTTFRAGSTLYFYSGKHISLWLNFAYEKKQFYEDLNYHYNQFSYLGGIKWKI